MDETLQSFINFGQDQALAFLEGQELPESAQNVISQQQNFVNAGQEQVLSNLEGEEVNLQNIPNLPTFIQQGISNYQQIVDSEQAPSDSNGEGVNVPNLPNANSIGNAISTGQQFAQIGYNQVLANLPSENDPVTNPGVGNNNNSGAASGGDSGESNFPGVAFNFVDGQVVANFNNEQIPLFNLGAGGPVPVQQEGEGDFGGFGFAGPLSSFLQSNFGGAESSSL